MAATYNTIIQGGRCPCRGTPTWIQRSLNPQTCVQRSLQGKRMMHCGHTSTFLKGSKLGHRVKPQPNKHIVSKTLKTLPKNLSRYEQKIQNFGTFTKNIRGNSKRIFLQFRQRPELASGQIQLFSKKIIPNGPENETGEDNKIGNDSRVDQIKSVFGQGDIDILQKVIQAKQKIPPMPKLKLPSFPRFVLAEHAVMAPEQKLQETEALDSQAHSERNIKSVIRTDEINGERLNKKITQHNFEEALLHASEDPVVYRVHRNSQSKEEIRRRVITLAKKMDEMSKKSDTASLENNLYLYRLLATFASNLPTISKLKDVDIKKLLKKNYRGSPVEGSDGPLREQHDLEAALLNMYTSTVPAENVDTSAFEGHAENVKTSSEKPEKTGTNSVMKGLLNKTIMNNKKEKEVKKPKTKPAIVISQASIDNRTKALVETIRNAKTKGSKLTRIENLCKHIMTYPDARFLARQEGVLSPLLQYLHGKDKTLQGEIRKALALLGYAEPVKGRGVKILTIDGGGTRGIVAVEVLRVLEKQCGKPIHEIFDYICAVSSGAVLGFLLAIPKVSLDECEELFYTLTKDIFKRSTLVGTGQLVWNHAFYNTEAWTNILRDHHLSENLMIETAADPTNPKIGALSTLIQPSAIKPHLFRNYNVPDSVRSHYPGTCQVKLWEALRASTAAPGYFEECKLGDSVHQDGGLLCNNPTAIAVHECKLLWPNTPIQCIVSLGTGRYVPEANPKSNNMSGLRAKIYQLVMSATDTEVVHSMLSDCMAPGSYFRFNPYLSEDITLDENRMEKIETLQRDTRKYLRRNSFKISETVNKLNQTKNIYHLCKDWLETKQQIYHK
ncbi:calcium-independent phospholipase A2-gamma-like [Ptychodera flava]|uniref:calcium-independent phospholipase A2-gamma-like n=1 Tax=Ptychodera flava TaxID=63121 RepID=UPI00396A9330